MNEDCFAIEYMLNRLSGSGPPLTDSAHNFSDGNETSQNVTRDSLHTNTRDVSDDDLERLRWFLLTFVHPAVCAFGVVGNILNIVVLTRRFKVDSALEKAALFGMAALAVSDLLYCLVALPAVIFGEKHVMFTDINFFFIYKMYGHALLRIFSFTSTGLTVLLAVARYVAICYPLQARSVLDLRGTVTATVVMTLVCVLLSLPDMWDFKAVSYHCSETGKSIYMVDVGPFGSNEDFKMAVVTIWFIVCFLLPVFVLTFCNIHLIKALRDSLRLRRSSANVHSSQANHSQNVTPTLVAVILVFTVLVAPGKIVGFLYYVDAEQAEHLQAAIVVTNLLETVNFSVNFLLYCAVNKKFRMSLRNMLPCKQLKPKFGESSHVTGINKNTTISYASRVSLRMQQLRVDVEAKEEGEPGASADCKPEQDSLL